MYFKQIEMAGFKSFADRTVIPLEQGMTAIVGPNGCGKSNILDAMRWALGEQSAKALRGAHMQDVIFTGSENRQAMGMAEVTVTFDNSDSLLPLDFAEVAVTRRVYRSGESEYLINKAACRLRDVQELFMDTGIGTNAYSLIGQGKIDLVLSSKPEDRRFLFEEAAGIIKYKTRKRVAMRKLDIAEQNLLRLNDIILEVQRQMRSLKRQVNAARRYRDLSDKLRELEIRFVWTRYAALVDEIKELRKRFAEAQDAYEKATAQTSTIEARNEELSLGRLETDRVLAARRDGVHQIDGEMEKIDRQLALLRQQIDFSKKQQATAAREHAEFEERATTIQARMAQTRETMQTVQAEIEDAKAAIETKQSERDLALEKTAQADKHLETMRAQTVETMNFRAQTHTELETLAVSIRNIDTLLEGLREREKTHLQRSEELAAKLQELQEAASQTRIELESLAAEQIRATEEHAEKTEQMRAMNEQWQSLREQKSSTEARLRSLRELRDSYEGYAAGVRAIMAAKKEDTLGVKGVVGPVGDLLSTQKAYERAVEAALGGNINNIVVEEADAAKSAIAFLKERRAGRVTFLPLDIIRPGQDDSSAALRGLPGIIGPVIEYVTYDLPIEKAVEYLLYNTVIVETIDDAIRIARSEKRFPRLVTLDGEVVSPSGAVTGGQTQHESRGLLGRGAEIAELEEHAAKTEGDLQTVAEEGRQVTAEIQQLSEQLGELEQQAAEKRRERNTVDLEIAKYSTERESLTQTLTQLGTQREESESARVHFESQRQDALARANTMELDDVALQEAVVEAQQQAAEAREALGVHVAELADLRVQLAALSQRLEEVQRDGLREQQEQEAAVRDAERRVEQVAQFKKNEALLEEEVALNIERSRALSESLEEARKKVVEAQNQQQALLDETETLAKTLRDLHGVTRETQAEVHRLEIELRHDEDQIGFFEERILSEYHVALASLDAEQVGTDEYDDETREAMVAEIRQKLDRLGQVNVMAIEEYEALEKRNSFLVAQEEDLRKAREALLGVVSRIDKTILAMFMETFEQVSDNFRTFFRRLFNGGQARIYLLDESDPLESGIEIEARPPGKKPQSIALLSGGEQALTAIALLFSIFKAKPSPFCVLDEVDAPLDDANIGRFLELVDDFTDESQFIIITHSKQTMARANVLYGVTMQERGVSQMVSVRFDEVPEGETT